jgi:hypothetical protein
VQFSPGLLLGPDFIKLKITVCRLVKENKTTKTEVINSYLRGKGKKLEQQKTEDFRKSLPAETAFNQVNGELLLRRDRGPNLNQAARLCGPGSPPSLTEVERVRKLAK